MKTPEELKAQKAKQMKAYRQKLKEANPEEFLKKQREQKQTLRAKIKENQIFIVPCRMSNPKNQLRLKSSRRDRN